MDEIAVALLGELTERRYPASILVSAAVIDIRERLGSSHETSLAITKLQEAMLWLGMSVEELP